MPTIPKTKKKQPVAKKSASKKTESKKKTKSVFTSSDPLFVRLDEFVIKRKGDNYNKLALELGLSRAYFSTLQRQNSSMTSSVLIKLLEHYPDLSAEWLLRGNGLMLVGATSHDDVDNRFAIEKLLSKLDLAVDGLREEVDTVNEINQRLQLATNRKKRGF